PVTTFGNESENISLIIKDIYAELFTSKWEEYKGHKKLTEELEKFLVKNRELDFQLKISNQTNHQLNERLTMANQRLEGLEKREKSRLKYLTCTYCKEVFETEAALRGHKEGVNVIQRMLIKRIICRKMGMGEVSIIRYINLIYFIKI
ncbi:MAG: hypothetical protein ACOCXH_04605, partial [Cyclobacteriaceae bacterium]